MKKVIVSIIFIILLTQNESFAECRCVCLDGKSQQLCNSNIDNIVGFYETKKYFLSFSAPRLSQTKLRNFLNV